MYFNLDPTLVASVTAVISAIAISVSAYVANRDHESRTKIASAELSMKMVEVVRREEFRSILRKVGTDENLDPTEINRILTHYEYVASFANNGVIKHKEVLHQHGRNIKALFDNKQVRAEYDRQREENPDYNYTELHTLYPKIDKEIKS